MAVLFDPSRRRLLQASASLGLAAISAQAMAADSSGAVVAAAKAGLARVGGQVPNHDVVGVADFGSPSSNSRLHLVDLTSGRTASVLVAHGRGSDPRHTGWLTRFSNDPGSDCTCEGAFLTGADYVGEHGRSMRLQGLDRSNDNAEARAIVVHAAPYVSPAVLRAQGMLGRSLGCFAVSQDDLATVLDRLGPGRLLLSTKL